MSMYVSASPTPRRRPAAAAVVAAGGALQTPASTAGSALAPTPQGCTTEQAILPMPSSAQRQGPTGSKSPVAYRERTERGGSALEDATPVPRQAKHRQLEPVRLAFEPLPSPGRPKAGEPGYLPYPPPVDSKADARHRQDVKARMARVETPWSLMDSLTEERDVQQTAQDQHFAYALMRELTSEGRVSDTTMFKVEVRHYRTCGQPTADILLCALNTSLRHRLIQNMFVS